MNTKILITLALLFTIKCFALPAASDTQRIAALEAYVSNSDPSTALKDTNGVVTATSPIANFPGPGHNAWVLTSTALVLFMTLPGLALFYGGMVRRKNVLSIMAQCLMLSGLVTILWISVGYSMIFAGSGVAGKEDLLAGVIGSPCKAWLLHGVTSAPNSNYSYWISENLFSMFQLMFAIITPALILGAIAERMAFKAVLIFMSLWLVLVYFTQGHMIWGINGLMNGLGNPLAKIKAIDFAGGTVVHMTSGWSALVLCLLLGKRYGFGKTNFTPHSLVLTFIGTGMLWVGWYGFNAGSALAADSIAAVAFTTTTIATAVASFVWPCLECWTRGKPSMLGFCSGAIAGLVVITPACGFVTPGGALLIGIVAGSVPWFFCWKIKNWLGYDDALDTFGVHAIGGTLGALMTGFLARNTANGNLATNLKGYVTDTLLQPIVWEQCKAIVITIILSVVGTLVAAGLTGMITKLRVTEEVEEAGLDITEHGEEGYQF